MNEKSALEFPFGNRLEAGHSREVAPGVLWLSIPLPTRLGEVNVWAVRDAEGWAVFDTGMQTEEAMAAWELLFESESALGGLPITRVICTHLHADHMGLAGWLSRRFDCELWMTRLEYLQCRVWSLQGERPVSEEDKAFHRKAGWDELGISQFRPLGRNMLGLPERYRRLSDSQVLRIGGRDWRVVVGNGHSPEHACFHCAELGLLISGDQVLPLVSSNVSVNSSEPAANPLRDWLSSLKKVRHEVPDDVLVLPAHNAPFKGLHARLDDLERKREKALRRLREDLAIAPRRAVDAFQALFMRDSFPDLFVRTLATGEAVAYMNYLMAEGTVTAEDDVNGVTWYRMLKNS